MTTASGIPGSAVELVGTDFDGALFAFVAVDPNADPDAVVGTTSSVGIQVVVEGR